MDYGLSKDMCFHGFRGFWLMGFLETCASADLGILVTGSGSIELHQSGLGQKHTQD